MKKHLIGLFVLVSALLMLMSTAFAASDYTITDIRLTDLGGNSINYTSGSCMVNVSVTKNNDVTDGYVVISSYTEDGTFIGFNYLYTNLDAGESATLGAMVVPPEDSPIALIKATVWNSLSSMMPLSTSKTLVPGEEPEEIDLIVDGTLINSQSDTKRGVAVTTGFVDGELVPIGVKLHIKQSAGTNAKNAEDYTLTTDAKLYVNGFEYCTIAGFVGGALVDNSTAVQELIAGSKGNTVLVQAAGEEDGVYDKVMIDVYALAQVTQVKVTSSETSIKLTSPVLPTGVTAPGLNIVVTNNQVEDGDKVVTVTRNGSVSSLDALQVNDIVAVKYDLTGGFDAAKYIDILATNETATGIYTSRDPDTNTYTVGDVGYKASNSFSMNRGSTYILYLDPFGDIFAVEIDVASINYVIVEAYTTAEYAGTDYDYIDVVTLHGESKRLYVEEKYADAVGAKLLTMLGADSYADRAKATTTDIYDRLITYAVKPSTGRVLSVGTFIYYDTLCEVEFNPTTNRLGAAMLSDSVVVLDATKYEAGKADTYKASSVASILEDTLYDAILVHQIDSDRTWAYVIITKGGNLYSKYSDFAVVSSKAFSIDSATVIDGEDYAVLRVAGTDTPLYVSMFAEVYVSGTKLGGWTGRLEDGDHLLSEGTVFFYTTDADGFVDRIDIVANVSSIAYDFESKDTDDWDSIITLPGLSDYSDDIRTADWQVGMMYSGTPMFSEIQFFYAPVVYTNSRVISFAELEYVDDYSKKFDTSYTYDFLIADDANIVAYDWSNKGQGPDAFSDGTFYGIDMAKVGSDNFAWVYADGVYVPESVYDFNGEVCYALVMAVDEVITNAVIFENVD